MFLTETFNDLILLPIQSSFIFKSLSHAYNSDLKKKKRTADFIQKISLLGESSFVETGHFTALPVLYKEKKKQGN